MDKNRNNDNENQERLQDQIGSGRTSGADQNLDQGGLADLTGATRRDTRNSTGSGTHSKSNVTGSDLDGQVADQ